MSYYNQSRTKDPFLLNMQSPSRPFNPVQMRGSEDESDQTQPLVVWVLISLDVFQEALATCRKLEATFFTDDKDQAVNHASTSLEKSSRNPLIFTSKSVET
ncbi:hypothetical protein RF11_11311 [Thelohanellus kitauei]|uniref:Uncharacterized protein n=1 Tax=Thelohanellus kitauei TaxID=669202 RepID=A0A0C2MHT0_THEKT|nr:hypothetical protein RF11_11311 [Thelohanellus kitauei]